MVCVSSLVIDLATRRVSRDDQPICLTPTEYKLICLLAHNLGRVLTHSASLKEVGGPGYPKDTQLLRGFVAQIRQQIEPTPNRPHSIITEPSIGYRMMEHPST